LHDIISAILCGDDCEVRKPHRAFLEARFGTDLAGLGKIAVIGDQFVDAEFANNIGGNAILVARVGEIAHLDRLKDWESYAQIVTSLHDVRV
jgi:phosphoglycolate phosphatase-like HAD superfamily hydrolase